MDELGYLEDVLYCEEFPYNLLSIKRMQNSGLSIIFDENGVHIKKNNKIIMTGKLQISLYIVELRIDTQFVSQRYMANSSFENDYKLWHQRLGHICKKKFIELKSKSMLNNIDLIENVKPVNDLCEACIIGKQTRLPYKKEKNKDYISNPLHNIHSDICGPVTPSTVDDKNYFITFIDDFTHYSVMY